MSIRINLSSRDYTLYHTLLLHNSDDMKGMLEILPILSYYDLFNNSLKARKVQANYYNDIHGIPRRELLMKLIFPPLSRFPSLPWERAVILREKDMKALSSYRSTRRSSNILRQL